MDTVGSASRRVHVLHLLGNAIVGGMETSVIRLARELPQTSFRMSVLCPFESFITSELRNAGCNVLIAPVRDNPSWEAAQTAATFGLDEHVDVVHAHLANAHVLGAVVSSLTQRPCLATIHGRSLTMLDLEAHRLAETMHMCVVCGVAYSHARTLGVARDRLHLIPNGVPPADATPALDLRVLLGVASDAPIVGFVGRLSSEKAPDAFVRMAWLVANEHPTATFVVIGNGAMRSELKQMVRAFDIEDRVHFLGERHDVRVLLPSLTLLALTSRAEGMPLALMEAMAEGVPVVATAVGGVPELVEHDRSGLLVGPGDVTQMAEYVVALLDDAKRRQTLGQYARSRAEKLWSQHTSATQMARLYRKLAGVVEGPRIRPGTSARVRLADRADTPVQR
jgi:glycosyltransferase involved in cell wall biosynthesis